MNSKELMTYDEILEKMKDIHIVKNHDYGNAFAEALDFSGYGHATGIMFQKLRRFKNLVNCQDEAMVKDEPIEDTLIDLANYAVLTLEHLNNANRNVHKEPSDALDERFVDGI